ncbi:CGNR zinc finger domain-containing protein [Actinomadura gamaensis]|uniref:CGNR zinc finger domain-containing protein n=1 Tax=Actinomadura gamaensis TaxID=1763541 RepID=A0ABV9TZB9_9ACTN
MPVNPYGRTLLCAVIDLLNRPPDSPGELADRWAATGMPLESDPGPDDLATVRGYLAAWSRLVGATTDTERVALLNEMLARYATPPTITDHDGSGWHIHYRRDDASFGGILTAATTVAAAQHLTGNGMHRLGFCALPECTNAYVDFSRPGRQRYCSHPCSNRDAVRRHRTARKARTGGR